jgi:hypothetical protein
MPDCLFVTDLSPLAACSQLEELWMAGVGQVASLAPLKACPRLRKLDLRDCRSVPRDQVADLQLSCTHLLDPSTVEIEGTVLELRLNMPPNVQANAARALVRLAANKPQGRTDIGAAGAIPLLVQLRGQSSSPDVCSAAAEALLILGVDVP